MATQFEIDCALMAGLAYQSTRDKINWFPTPDGWQQFSHVPNSTYPADSGFEAVAFQNAATGAIVISYAGTYDKDLLGDVAADAALGAGLASSQLYQAAEYYMKVKASNPTASITFTGHSLGGGLASLMAVFFNETAVTFDQAPFRNSASFVNAASLMTALTNKFPVAGYPQIATWLAPLDRFISSFDPLGLGWSTDGLAARETKVTTQSVQGEFLSAFTALRIGSELPPLTHGDYFSPLNLHSQALLAAFLQSDQTASTNATTDIKETLSRVTFKLTGLLAMLFDEKLFAHTTDRTNSTDDNLLERLVRHEEGVRDTATGTTTIGADAMLSRFTRDLWKLAQDGGLTMDDGSVFPSAKIGAALIAFSMQMYYEDTTNATNNDKELFTKVTGGIQFDMADVSKTFKVAFDNYEKLNLDVAKGYKEYFTTYLNTNTFFTPEERGLINSTLPQLRDWYVQAGADGLNATDSLNRGAFLLGGKGSDALVGGSSADLLVGNGGDDLLMGGKGNDILLGGNGTDNYVYTTGDGLDTILDKDGQGRIAMDGAILAGGAQYGDTRVHRDADKRLYVQVDEKTLIIDGNIIVKNYTAGETILGLNMTDPVADINPVTTLTITGDISPTDINPEKSGIQADGDAQGNPIGTAQPYEDIRRGSNYNEHILTGELNDDLSGEAGDDWLEGGSGNDFMHGGTGNDLLEGGADRDILSGEGDNDRIYGNTRIATATAIANGAGSGSGQKGDWLSGNTGDDTLIAGADNDVLAGGAGNDLLIAGAGDDNILGDADYVAAYRWEDTERYSIGDFNWFHSRSDAFAWTVTPGANTSDVTVFFPADGETNPVGGGADVIYAGSGNDHVWAGEGNDAVFGEAGDDSLAGNDGNDILLGGVGNDIMWGGKENDYLDGGDDADDLYGDEGDDLLIGGKGDDILHGGTGQDTYLFNAGDGNDTVDDTKAENNIIRFGAGVNKDDITLRLGSLMLDLGNGDAVHIEGFDQSDVFNSASVSGFEFADGSTLTTTELLARGFDLDGTAEGETIIGTNTTDRINGKGGADYLAGGAGDDTYIVQTGDGAPTYDGYVEVIVDESGNDTVRFDGVSTGNFKVSTFIGDTQLLIEYGSGDQLNIANGINGVIENFEIGGETLSTSELVGHYSDTSMSGIGAGGYPIIAGGRRDDLLIATAAFATLSGGRGNDTISASGDNTTLRYSVGDGSDRVTTGGSGNVLRLGAGITAADLKLGLGSLALYIGNDANDVIHFESFDAANPLAQQPFARIEFADGSSISYEDLLSRGFDLVGTSSDDAIDGSGITDRMTGGAGNDALAGLAGDDMQDGGAGNDQLTGGTGSDTYVFNAGDGQDVIINGAADNVSAIDTLRLGAGITAADLVLNRIAADLLLRIGASDSVTLKDYFAALAGSNTIDRIAFADATVWDQAAIEARDWIQSEGDNDQLQGGADAWALAGLDVRGQCLAVVERAVFFAANDTKWEVAA